MKIQAINNQVSSKGIYVDRSNENHRNWKMVYHPYSWELDGEGKPYIAPKNKIDIPKLINIIIRFIDTSIITFLISESVNTEKYFKNSTSLAIVEKVCNT